MRVSGFAVLVALTAASPVAAQSPAAVPYGAVAVHSSTLACADVPTATVPSVPLRIVGVQDTMRRSSFAPGDSVVLNQGRTAGIEPGQRYYIRRATRGELRRPISAANPGAVRTAGWLTVTAVDDVRALGRIDAACDAVRHDDYLEPYEPVAVPAAPARAGAPQHDQMARVLPGTDQTQVFGAGALVPIDRGTDDGIGTGTQFVVYRDTRSGGPLVIVGEAVVVAAGPAFSTVVLTRTQYEVQSGDYLAPRAATP
jgi:primosomal replication protein N